MRESNINPQLLAHQILYRNLYFNQTPLAPPGTKLTILEAKKRGYWRPHREILWYLGTEKNQNLCYECFIITPGAKE